ncbi:hypothetical protein [Flavobacterium commune]|uniref:Uncharacterized protein n=1 Tax=Flavobacterium commune TaxID=1306519 RepID=A0A1D9PAQ0_9FLAO|nr:hypothetical protein [Flavobacterium commune]AOZ99617.1 hypothetical protein BIW12_09275 [Flavobacterium commune]
MQNSKITVQEFDKTPIQNFFNKLRVAYNLIKAEKSIVIIGDKIESFNLDPEKVMGICGKISINLKVAQELKEMELQDQLVSESIHRLVYN